jgi:phenylacetic acid degradation operon negative regulatory protein
MKKPLLHHPDISLPVLRRRATDFFLDCVMAYTQFAMTRGRSGLASSCFSSNTAYRSAVCRLRKAGIITYRKRRDGARVIALSGVGYTAPDELRPDRLWNSRWDGLWRVLVYDIEEKERGFRNGLRKYLSRLRMGYLQQSVWVSPRDLRPAYADLHTVLNVEAVSFLFESRTVLSRESRDIVLQAWDFDGLQTQQRAYLDTCAHLQEQVHSGRLCDEELSGLVRQEMLLYLDVMRPDPLLPRKLLPSGYCGMEAYKTHRAFVDAACRCMN